VGLIDLLKNFDIKMNEVLVKNLGNDLDYQSILEKMRDFTLSRNSGTQDEIWVLEHSSVYTLGQAGKPEHILNPKAIPIVKSDRGGQVTYHGPGQIVLYLLLNIQKLDINIKQFVCALEQASINFLKHFNIDAHRIDKAPGIYVKNKKICSIGLRVKKGCTYHGIAFNTKMDLMPFKGINPCGYKDLEITQFNDLYKKEELNLDKLKDLLIEKVITELNLTQI
tara:strand:- start:40462 stop:41130 length:669 start_codon:yes stop_codon:yes gene_type:complete